MDRQTCPLLLQGQQVIVRTDQKLAIQEAGIRNGSLHVVEELEFEKRLIRCLFPKGQCSAEPKKLGRRREVPVG